MTTQSRLAASLFTLALLCAPVAARAADATVPDCGNATTQAQMNTCADQALQRAEARHDQLFQELLSKTAAKKQKRARKLQESWKRYRDLQCGYEAIGYEGGSMAPLVTASCLTELTNQRNATLERQLRADNPN